MVFIPQVSPAEPCRYLSSPHTFHMSRPSRPSWIDHSNNILYEIKKKKNNSALCKLIHSTVTSSLLGPDIFLSAIFASILNTGHRIGTNFCNNCSEVLFEFSRSSWWRFQSDWWNVTPCWLVTFQQGMIALYRNVAGLALVTTLTPQIVCVAKEWVSNVTNR